MAWKFNTDRPIYLQIIDVIKKRIITGEYAPGAKLPSVRELAEEATVNPNTMQRALAQLESEELVFTNRTAGRFITDDTLCVENLRKKYAENETHLFLEKLTSLGYSLEDIKLLLNEIYN